MSVKVKIILISVSFLLLPFIARADTLGQEVNFNIDSSFDSQGRKEAVAILQEITDKLYIYVDKDWWQGLSYSGRRSLDVSFNNLTTEFERKIYPTLTSTFGSEPKLDFGNNEKITVLIHPMISDAGGYFNSGDVYEKLQNSLSNERAMVYLNSQHIGSSNAKVLLAHEFMHLITVNQKNLLRGLTEDTWLDELRSEYSATFLGYDDTYKGSTLEKRVKDFLVKPTVSLVEWLNRKEDYGAVNLFGQYLVDHYGIKVLAESLQSGKVGIESINLALLENNYDKDFTQVFSDWLIALLVNNCQLGDKYCYLNDNLENFRITPTVFYLPRAETVMSSSRSSTYWAGNWHRFIGGGSSFILQFAGTDSIEFEVPYLLCDLQNKCSVEFLSLAEDQKGGVSISEFDSKYSSLTLMPFISDKISEFDGVQKAFSFSWEVKIQDKREEPESELILRLLAQIEELKRQIAEMQAEIGAIPGNVGYCSGIEDNLYFGMTNSAQVSCLQEFLKSQGPDIYPEALVSGNFLSLTQLAVIRFQEKYASEILAPLDLEKGTGYVGQATRAKINSLISG